MSVRPISDQQAVVAASPLSEQAQGALASANAKYAALIARGAQPSLEGMPGEILSHITSYLPYIIGHQGVRDPRQFLSQVNWKWRNTITNQMVQQFEGHPDIAHLLKCSSWMSNASDEKKIALIRLYLDPRVDQLMNNLSLHIGDTDRDFRDLVMRDVYSGQESLNGFIKARRDALNELLQKQHILIPSFDRREFNRTRTPCGNILLNAIILQDANYLRSVTWEYQPFDVVNMGCSLSLFTGQREVFNATLPHSSLYATNDLPSVTSQMSWLLGLAARNDDIELFQKFLGYNKPYPINGLLCALALLNSPKCMAHLLTLEGIKPDAFAAALERAAIHNRQNAVHVMLQARPGREISREVLTQIVEVLTELEELARQDERGLPPATVQVLQLHRRLDPQGEGIRAMCDVLTQEIANRYPVEEGVVDEEVPPAQAEAVLLQGHEQAIPQAQEILLQALARAHVARAQAQAMPAQAEAAPEQARAAPTFSRWMHGIAPTVYMLYRGIRAVSSNRSTH